MMGAEISLTRNLADVVDNMPQVRSVCAEGYEAELMQKYSETVRGTATRMELNFTTTQTLQNFTFFSVEAVIYIIACFMYFNTGSLKVEDITQLMSLLAILINNLWSVSRLVSTLIHQSGMYNTTVRILGSKNTRH